MCEWCERAPVVSDGTVLKVSVFPQWYRRTSEAYGIQEVSFRTLWAGLCHGKEGCVCLIFRSALRWWWPG